MPDAVVRSRSRCPAQPSSGLQGIGADALARRRLAEAARFNHAWEAIMSVARVTEIISSSDQSFEHAVKEGVERANQTLENIKEAWVASQKVVVESGRIVEYRVTLKVTFVLR
jgi:flavin-binding protein dodecin